MKRRFHILIIIALIAAFIFPWQLGATPATRALLEEARRLAEEGRRGIAEQERLLDGTRFEIYELMQEMEALDMAWAEGAFALEMIQLTIEIMHERIYQAEIDLEIAHEELDVQYQILRDRLRAMHEIGTVGLLDVLFQATSITDFFLRMEKVRAVAELDQLAFANFEAAEATVQSRLDELGRAQALLLYQEWAQMAQLHDMELLQEEKDAFFMRLQEDEERMEMWLFLREEEQIILDAALGIAQQQWDRELAEEERIRREQAARAAAERRAQQQAADAARLANLSTGPWHWPVEGHFRVTSEFGMRTLFGRTAMHNGTDVGAPTGTRVFAMQEGYVTFAGWSGGYGLMIRIDHANGYSTLYAHHSVNRVEVGQFVARGQHIADVGSTGQSTGPHLHFEIIRGGRRIDPMSYFR